MILLFLLSFLFVRMLWRLSLEISISACSWVEITVTSHWIASRYCAERACGIEESLVYKGFSLHNSSRLDWKCSDFVCLTWGYQVPSMHLNRRLLRLVLEIQLNSFATSSSFTELCFDEKQVCCLMLMYVLCSFLVFVLLTLSICLCFNNDHCRYVTHILRLITFFI